MTKSIQAIFDGKVLKPEEPVDLAANTRVRLVIEVPQKKKSSNISFFKTARSIKLNGPPDWSERLEEYLYGEMTNGDK